MRNVVLVSIDSLRADHCGFMGYEKDTTPTLDAMAEEGLSFESAVAPGPSTYESMPAVITGRHMCQYPSDRTDEDTDVFDDRGSQISANTRPETIAEWFDRQGYGTAAFTMNPYTGSHTNFARGFDYYEDFLDGGEGPLMQKAADLPVLSELKHVVTLVRGDRASKPWQDYYDDILEWVQSASEPYFLWVFLLDPHTPYLAPGEYRGPSSAEMYYRNWKLWAAKKWGIDLPLDADALRSLYDATIRSSDEFLKSLRSDLPGDPIIAVHADHGEAFGEHGTLGHHKELYEENLHVPFAVWNAATTRTVEYPVSLTAIPSVLSQAATGEVSIPSRGHVLARTLGPRRVALRDGDWKYIATTDDQSDHVKTSELYDLESDPAEREDRSVELDDRVDTYRRLVERRLSHEREVSRIYRKVPAVV